MKLLAVLCLVAVAVAAPPPRVNYPSDDAQLVTYENEELGFGRYRYGFEQSDGTKQEQQGELKNEGSEDESIAVKGTFTWIAPDGVRYTVTYVADENGYQPEFEEGPGAVPPHLKDSLLG